MTDCKYRRRHARATGRLAPICAALLSAIIIAGALTGCSEGNNAVTYVKPDLPKKPAEDTRTFTDVSAYASRRDTAFSSYVAAAADTFSYELTESGAVLTGYLGEESVVVVPDTLGGMTVTGVSRSTFEGRKDVRAICLPPSLLYIEEGAFSGCSSLSTLRTPVIYTEQKPYFGALFGAGSYEINASFLPGTLETVIVTDGVTSVPEGCFYGCYGLSAVFLPDTVRDVGAFAFYGCSSLAYVDLGGFTETVGAYALANCESLLTVTFPAGVSYFGASVLEGCLSLEWLEIPFVGRTAPGLDTAPMSPTDEQASGDENDGAERTPDACLGYLFGSMTADNGGSAVPTSLISVTLNGAYDTVSDMAFADCAYLRRVTLPETVRVIGCRAFYRCARLSEINFPSGLENIGDDAFHGCLSLERADLTPCAHVTFGRQSFFMCVGLSDVALPETVNELPNGCFAYCAALASVTGSDAVTGEWQSGGTNPKSPFYACGQPDRDTAT